MKISSIKEKEDNMIHVLIKKIMLLLSISPLFMHGSNWESDSNGVISQADGLALLESFIVGDIPQGVKDIVLFPEIHHNILLHGPEGTGKTTIVKALTFIKNAELLQISGGSIVSEFQGSGAGLIDTIFQKAEKLAASKIHSIVFIDEIDAIAKERTSKNQNNEHGNALISLGMHLEAIEKDPELSEYIFFAAATNRYASLDTFFLSRMRNKVEICLPNVTTRKKILQKIFMQESDLLTDSFFTRLANQTDLFSGRDLEVLYKKARCNQLREKSQYLSQEHIEKELPVLQKDAQLLVKKRKLLERKDKDELDEKSFFSKHASLIISTGVGVAGLALTCYMYRQGIITRAEDLLRSENQYLASQQFQRDLIKESPGVAVDTQNAIKAAVSWPRYIWDGSWDVGKSIISAIVGAVVHIKMGA